MTARAECAAFGVRQAGKALCVGPQEGRCMMDQSYHYKLIARAIALIDAPGGTARSLDDLASELGLSPAHFQRVFSAWAGVSPKRYQQYLTLEHARHLLQCALHHLRRGAGAWPVGQARLHDLFLRWESMTPGEYARTVRWPWHPTWLVRQPVRPGPGYGHGSRLVRSGLCRRPRGHGSGRHDPALAQARTTSRPWGSGTACRGRLCPQRRCTRCT